MVLLRARVMATNSHGFKKEGDNSHGHTILGHARNHTHT